MGSLWSQHVVTAKFVHLREYFCNYCNHFQKLFFLTYCVMVSDWLFNDIVSWSVIGCLMILTTVCDWLIAVDTCIDGCSLITPGYSGIYPPNIKCRYTIINFEDARVEIKFGGKYGTKFDLKRRYVLCK